MSPRELLDQLMSHEQLLSLLSYSAHLSRVYEVNEESQPDVWEPPFDAPFHLLCVRQWLII